MKERRSLVEGLNSSDTDQQEREQAFVYGKSSSGEVPTPESKEQAVSKTSVTVSEPRVLPQYTGRVPVTTRTRPEVASALKRAALTRQLDGVVPYTVQDIVEEALELWLLKNGYLER